MGIVEVLGASRGKSPLIIGDLDVYPQLPRITGAPTLNSEEPYMRAGILCWDLTTTGSTPALPQLSPPAAPVGVLVDEINARFGTGTLGLGRAGTRVPGPWANRQNHLSPCYTTDWTQLRTVH